MPLTHLVDPRPHHLPQPPPTTNITIGEDTYTVLGAPDNTISVIRRSGRWRRNGRRSSSPKMNGETGTAECSSLPTPLSRENGKSEHANGNGSQTVNGGQPDHGDGSHSGDGSHPGDGADADGGQPAAVLPSPDSPAACAEAHTKLQYLIASLREDSLQPEVLLSNLEYIGEVLGVLAARAETSVDEDLSSLRHESVPEEVRLWLAATFAKQEKVVKRSEERPTLRSVANAIRTGIFIEKIYRRMSKSQMMAIPEAVEQHLQHVNNWNFDLFQFSKSCHGSPLKYMGYHLLNQYGCCHKYKIPPSLLETLLGHLEVGYHRNGNPYHNNLHATDVLQTTHWLISQTGVKDWLTDIEIFALLFSAIIHDYDHSGTTNNFHIQSNSSLAFMYNDRSVLENHHVAAFFRTMQDNDCFILGNMSMAEFREFRSLMIEMVLHTDMSMHFSQLKHMKNLVQTAADGGSFDKTRVLCLLLHSCDISHPAKEWALHYQWTARCMEEFFKQGDKEQEQGLDFSPLCDRQTTMVPQSQIGFIDFIVSPTLNVCGDVISLVAGRRHQEKPWEENLQSNKQLWQEKADAGDTGAPASAASRDEKPPRPLPATLSMGMAGLERKKGRSSSVEQ